MVQILQRILLTTILTAAPIHAMATEAGDLGLSESEYEAYQALFDEDQPQQEDVFRADKFLISATGSLKPVFLAPSVATVITKKEIEAMGATTIDEVMETVPGLHVTKSPVNGFSSVWSMRGIHTGENPHVLLLLNSVPVIDHFVGYRPSLLRMPVSMIRRIEVVRGPGSAVYGAEAFAGTVNIITKDGQEIGGTEGGVRYDSFDGKAAWVQHGGNYEGWDVAMGLDYQKGSGDGDRIVDSDRQTVLDGLFGTTASQAPGPLNDRYNVLNAHLSLNKDDRWKINLWGYRQRDVGTGPGLIDALNDIDSVDTDTFLADALYTNDEWLDDWRFDLRGSYVYNKLDPVLGLFPPGAVLTVGNSGNFFTPFTVGPGVACPAAPALPVGTVLPAGCPTLFTAGVIGGPTHTTVERAFEATAFHQIGQHNLRFSAGYKDIDTSTAQLENSGPGILDGTQGIVGGTLTDLSDTPFVFVPDANRQNKYASIQDEWAFRPGWELTAGVRYDNFSDFGTTVNPRAAVVWQARPDLVTKLLYGEAFRAPSFSEQLAQNNPAFIGNPNLEPEALQVIELVFDYQPRFDMRAVLSLFRQNIEGIIDFIPDPGTTTSTAQNAFNQKSWGGELTFEWNVNDKLDLNINMAYQKTRDKDTGALAADAPQRQLYINPHWKFLPKWSLDAQYFWIGDRPRAAGDTRPRVDDYSLVNLTLRRKKIAKRWDIALSVRNVLDEDVREPADPVVTNDYPMDGRSVWAEIRVRL